MTSAPDLETDLNLLLGEIREEWEFTSALDAAALLKAHPVLAAHAFARAILEAENLSPYRESSWMRRLKRRFVQRYRADSISAASFTG